MSLAVSLTRSLQACAFSLAIGSFITPPALADYQAPDLEKPLMGKGKLGLDADAMQSLSRSIVGLQGSEEGWTPKVQRRHAKIVALAHFLDPTSELVKKLNSELVKGAKLTSVDERRRIGSSNRVWQNIRWLSSKEAGESSNLLGAYLIDLMIEFDPEHPLAEKHDVDGEFGRWKAVVPPLRDFGGGEAVADNGDQKETPKAPVVDEPAAKPDHPPAETKRVETAFPRHKGPVIIHGIGRLYDSQRKNTYPTVIEFAVEGYGKQDDQGDWEFRFSPNPDDKANRVLEESKRALFRRYRRSGKARVGVKTKFVLSPGTSTTEAIELPIVLGLEGMVNNQKPRKDLIAFGSVSDDLKITGANSWWSSVKALRAKEGSEGRVLLVPDNIADEFVNIVALNEPEFFIRYECFRVKNLDEAYALTFGDLPAGAAKAMDLFDDLQKVAATKSINTLASNRYVRAKLEEALKASPNFLSAEMLLIQGSGRRPSKISRATLARELRTIIYRVDSALKVGRDKIRDGNRAMKVFDAAREEIDGLERHIDSSDREFYSEGIGVINYLRTIDREIRLSDNDNKSGDGTIRKAQADSDRLKAKIREALGEEDPNRLIIPK